ncbi:hypothetical protein [Candidatus Nitrosocosmicus franklandus]|uniref:Uncharacterized protein n=1 Tax=Candidatus Nitrosocosmicus franklandianus TaxID=1798806 RepID=A0A484IEW0_9ARCH|nr:hypothetical protein [Candidatus Nitrosocosmicus franklandus]VFJ14172.1 conserved protein of unknown function [Candidatus Nitrosocosmicus franklandus]
MSVTQISKEILSREPRIKFVGILKSDGQEISFGQDNKIDENDVKLSMIQTPHLLDAGKRFTDLGNLESVTFEYDKIKLVNLPNESGTVVCGSDNDLSIDEIKKIVSEHITGYKVKDEAESHTFYKEESKNNSQTIENLSKMQKTSNQFENAWQNYILTMIEFWKEMAITSIRMNEKLIKEFWKNYVDK